MIGIDTVFQIILAWIAFAVAYGLSRKKNVWGLILAYWCVLTVKNFVGLVV